MEDPLASDDSGPTSKRRAAQLALALGGSPARFAELVWASASSTQSPAKQPEFVFLSLSHAPDLPVL